MILERPAPDTTVVTFRFEHRKSALGVGTPEPRLSWQVRADDSAWRQTAYEVGLDGATAGAESAERLAGTPSEVVCVSDLEEPSLLGRVAGGAAILPASVSPTASVSDAPFSVKAQSTNGQGNPLP